jgi:hypothetical protein
MNEIQQQEVSSFKRHFLNLAPWYSSVVPFITIGVTFAILRAYQNSLSRPFIDPIGCAALVLISCFIMGIVSLFGNVVRGARRGWSLIGMIVSGIFGGLAIGLYWVTASAHQ